MSLERAARAANESAAAAAVLAVPNAVIARYERAGPLALSPLVP